MRPRLTWDRFTDFHLLMGLASALALAGAGVLALSLGGWSDAPPALRPIGWALSTGAFGLACWAAADRRAERRRRAKLDHEVDAELSGKWDLGFARAVGAYEKPWYLLCGETGVGKTAALRAADLPKALGPDNRPLSDPRQGINGTFMFDWWFLQDAVVLDSAGDLLQNPDRRWVSFLERVRAGRPLQPINGMIVAVAATDLLSGDADALRRKARLLARQVEVAREQLRVRFPLYVLVTKTDLVPGFNEYFPDGSGPTFSNQILGWSNPQDPRADDGAGHVAADEVRQGLRQFIDELRDQRGSLLGAKPAAAGTHARRIDALDGMFTFPRAVAGFLGALEQLVDELLGSANTAVAPPFLRGIYFSSALQTEPAKPKATAPRPAPDAFGLDDAMWDLIDKPAPAPAGTGSRGAFFLRDLLLEKIIPESGIVTPLQDVVSGVRRRGRTLVTASLVASLLVGGTAVLGYVQTAGRTRPHSTFWAQLVDKAHAGTLPQLALFDPAGHYQGARLDPAMGTSVLGVHEEAADLAAERTSTWLLPLSARADGERREAHRELFRDMVLRPLLTPPPAGSAVPRAGALPPPALVKAVTALAAAHAPTPPALFVDAAREMLRWRATWASIDAAQLRRVTDLLDRGARDEADAPEPVITPEQQKALVESLAGWLKTWSESNKAEISHWSRDEIASMTGARELVDREDAAALPERDPRDLKALTATLVDLSRPPAAALTTRPADSGASTRFQPPAALAEIRALLPAAGAGDKALAETAAALDQYDAFAAAQCRAVGKAAGLDLPEGLPLTAIRQPVADAVERFDAANLGPGKPLAVRRQEAYGKLLALVKEFDAPDAVRHRFDAAPAADYPHPLFRLPAVLTALREEIRHTRDEAPAAPFGPDTRRAAAFARAWNMVLDRALLRGESLAWDAALQSPDDAWQTPAARAAGRLELAVNESQSTSLVRTVHPSGDLDLRHLRAWLTAYRAAEAALASGALEDPIATRARLDLLGTRFEATATQYVDAWQSAARQGQLPNFTRWTDLRRLGSDGPAEIQARLNATLDEPRQGLAFLAGQDRFPLLRAAAAKALAPLNDRSLPSTALAIVEFLKSCDPDSAAATRTLLLRDAPALQERLAQAVARGEPGASAVQDFWAELMNRAAESLIAEARPAALDRLRDLHKQTDGRFPLCRSGALAWEQDDLTSLKADLDALRPASSTQLTGRLARRIRDLDAVDESWAAYVDWLRRFDTFLAAREPWTLEVNKGNGRGAWQAIKVSQPGAPDRPAAEQTFLDTDHPPVFTIDGGPALRGGLAVSLLNRLSTDGGIDAATFARPELSAPWSVLRLAVAGPDGQHVETVEPGKPAGTRFVTIKLSAGGASVLREMPEKAPPLPN